MTFYLDAGPRAALVQLVGHRYAAATERDPWRRLSRAERIDHVPPLLAALLDCTFGAATMAGEPGPVGRHAADEARRALDAARENAHTHGRHRRAQGFGEEILLEEFDLLRHQAYMAVREHLGVDGVMSFLTRFDAALTEATVASIRGFAGMPLAADGPTAAAWADAGDGRGAASPTATS
jgi:hypothetical protein